MQIVIKTPSEKTITLEVEASDSINGMKVRIQEQEGIPSEQQLLIFQSKTLEEDKLLSDYNIQEGSEIFLELKKKENTNENKEGNVEQEKKEESEKKEKEEKEKKEGEQEKKEGEPEKKEGEPEKKEGEPEKKEGESEKKEGESEKKEGESEKKEGESEKKEGEPEKKEGEQEKKEEIIEKPEFELKDLGQMEEETFEEILIQLMENKIDDNWLKSKENRMLRQKAISLYFNKYPLTTTATLFPFERIEKEKNEEKMGDVERTILNKLISLTYTPYKNPIKDIEERDETGRRRRGRSNSRHSRL